LIRIFSIVFACFFLSFKPGEPVATLSCKSTTGRTSFSGTFPFCSYLETAELRIDEASLKFDLSEDEGFIIFEPDHKVFTIYLSSGSKSKSHRFLKFWAVPSSFKKTKSQKGPGSQFHDAYEFRAYLYATEPRKTAEINTKIIELNCTLDYEL
jgi:hypothetical protein